MLAAQSALWASLLALNLDGAAALSFSKRLARDNGWPPAFAQRVVLEYKKFLYLAATCGHPVTPSDEVDQAWHLHLVYTRSYWDELCGQVLGFALHHSPTQGGAAEGQKFGDWYARTLASYRAAFGEVPPADSWPPAAVRFGEAPHFRRVNMRGKWLLPKPQLSLAWLARRWPGVLAGGALLVLVGCTARTPLNPFDWYGREFLTLYWVLCGTLYPLAPWLRHRGRGLAIAYAAGPLPPYQLARLASWGQLVADSALATLAYSGQLELLPKQLVRRTNAPWPSQPHEQAVWRLTGDAPTRISTVREQALSPNLAALRELDAGLEQKGLLLPPTERQRLNRIPTSAAVALGCFGLLKVGVGMARNRLVGYLLLTIGLLVVISVMAGWLGRAWTTGQGDYLLHATRTTVRRRRSTGSLSGELVTLWVALFGVANLKELSLGPLADFLAPATIGTDSGSGGCGNSGCGGGGCGRCGSSGCGS